MGQALQAERFPAVHDPETMAARVMEFAPATDSEALKLLRTSFPDCPLSARVAALDYLMRRRSRCFGLPGPAYRPR